MRLGEINAPSRQPGPVADPAEPELTAPDAKSRALIALAPAASVSERQIGYRHTPFLAQLIAMKDQHPQARERRRAEPNEALAAYRAAAALTR